MFGMEALVNLFHIILSMVLKVRAQKLKSLRHQLAITIDSECCSTSQLLSLDNKYDQTTCGSPENSS